MKYQCRYTNETSGPCLDDAEWLIVFGPNPEDYTHSCSPHVGYIIDPTADSGVIVFPIVTDAQQETAAAALAEQDLGPHHTYAEEEVGL
jgi:hypothetical protein